MPAGGDVLSYGATISLETVETTAPPTHPTLVPGCIVVFAGIASAVLAIHLRHWKPR
jgi:hypothetical protein